MFKTRYESSANTCRFRGCPRATDGYSTKQLLEEHEGSHTGGIKCAEPSCSFSRIGFKNSAGLKRHTNVFHATLETIIKPTVVRRQFVCGGNISEGTTPNLWGCAQHYARQDELNAHFRSPLGRRCIKQYVEAHISRPDHSMMIGSIPPGVEQALSRDQVSALQLMKNAKPETIERVQGSGQQLLRVEDVLKLTCINDVQKTKYKPLISRLWSIMENKAQDSQEHRQAHARLAKWSEKLIAEERIARQKAQQAAQQAGNRPQSQQDQESRQGQGQQRQPLQNAPSQTHTNPQGTQSPQINPEIIRHVRDFPSGWLIKRPIRRLSDA